MDSDAVTKASMFIPQWDNFIRALRHWDKDFLGIGANKPYGMPASLDIAVDRLRRNGEFFGMNYLVVLLFLTILAVLLHPVLVIIAVIYGAGLGFIATRPPNWTLVAGGQEITKKRACIISSVAFVLAAFIFARLFIFSFMFLAVVLICGHAAFRHPLNEKMDAIDGKPDESTEGV